MEVELFVGRLAPSFAPVAFADGGLLGPALDAGDQYLVGAAIARDPAGDVFLVGIGGVNPPLNPAVACVSDAGTSTVAAGYATPGPNGAQNSTGFLGVASASNGLAVAVGSDSDMAGSEAFVTRFTAAGALDHSFATNGIMTSARTLNLTYNAVAIDPFGRIIVAGNDSAGFYLVRMWP